MTHAEQLRHSIAVETAMRDIAERIRPVCEDLAEDDFLALVERIARIDVKYRLRDDRSPYFESPERFSRATLSLNSTPGSTPTVR